MSKYKANRVQFLGETFDSKVECQYYKHLLKFKDLGLIEQIKIHPKYMLQDKMVVKGETIRPIFYEADFEVKWRIDNTITVIDVKGMATPEAKLKRKLFLHCYPELELKWVCYNKKHSGNNDGWIEYFKLQKAKRKAKKEKRG